MLTAMNAAPDRGPDLQFQHYLSEGEFRLQQCDACHQYIFYPRVLCPHCGGTELTWNRVSGDGVVYSSTLVRRRDEKGGPYNVAIVELAEGPRMMSRVEGVAADQVTIGSAVSARIATQDQNQGERHILLFDAVTPAGGKS